jgi:hypothetical protein
LRRLPIGFARPEELQGWASTTVGQTILSIISIPFAFEDLILLPYGFLVLPWYTVIICAAVAVFVTISVWNFFLSEVAFRFGLFVAILFAYPVALLVACWYFFYLGEGHVISPRIDAYVGIALLLCYRILNALYTKKQSSL